MKEGEELVYPRTSNHDNKGLTKREYFAGLALQGLLAGNRDSFSHTFIELSIGYADALLEGLSQEN
jgi:hypothetical protein